MGHSVRANSDDENPPLANVDSLLATSSSDSCPDSQRTSWLTEESQGPGRRGGGNNSQGTSKAGDSWRGSQDAESQGTSKAGGSWRNSQEVDSQGTSKAGGSWRVSRTDSQGVDSQGTSKAGGSWRDSRTDSLGVDSQGTSKAGGSWRDSSRTDGQSMGGSSLHSRSRLESQNTSKAGGSGRESSTNSQGLVGSNATSGPHDRGRQKSSGSRGGTSGESSYATAQTGSSASAVGPDSSLSQFRMGNAAATAGMEPLTVPLRSRVGPPGTSVELPHGHRDFVYGDESRLSLFQPLEQTNRTLPPSVRSPPPPPSGKQKRQPVTSAKTQPPPPRGSGKRGGRGRGRNIAGEEGQGAAELSKTMSNLTIDNSVNAVRAWTAAVEQQRQQQEERTKAAVTPVELDGDDSFSKFLR